MWCFKRCRYWKFDRSSWGKGIKKYSFFVKNVYLENFMNDFNNFEFWNLTNFYESLWYFIFEKFWTFDEKYKNFGIFIEKSCYDYEITRIHAKCGS